MRLRFLTVAVLLIVVAWQAVAAPAGQQQYIVKTKHLNTPRHTKAAPSVQDVVRASGGHVDYEWRDRLVVTLPDAAVQALMQHPAVEFAQKVVSGIPDTATAPAGSAEPVVTSSAFRPAPKSLPPWTSGTYSYDGQGNITAIGSNAYSYDAFSRLATSTTNGIPETYTYDRYGNLTQKVTGTGSTALTVQSDVDDGNHLSGHCYDKAGNLTDDRDADPVHCPTATETYSFDALNRMTVKWNHITHTKEYYIYNANDERIAVIPCSETACTEQITFSFRDESGKVLRQFEVPYQQFDSPWTWVEDYVYRDGVLLAAERVPAQGGRRYFHTDHLGTPRLITDSSGRRISEHDYFPFGVEATPLRQDTLPVNGFNREEPMKFTGHERDFSGGTSSENSNYIDYMHARSTVPQWGRFLSVDPVNSASPSAPQSWNRYSYARNNPMALVDRTGQWPTKVLHTHQNAIDFTLRSLPAGDRQVLKQAQVTADLDQQNQYKHAMRNPGQSPHDAAILANKFIDTALSRAVRLEKAGNHTGALVNVGLAMHTLQDNTSPTHSGIQEFDPNKSNLSGATLSHVNFEFDDPSGDPQHVGLGQILDRATYDVYAHFANATGLPVPPVPQCNSRPCFTPSGETHVEVPPK